MDIALLSQSFQSDSTLPNISVRMAEVRDHMQRQGLNGLLIPHEDQWLSEYPHPSYDRLAWLLGFRGSAGMAIILGDAAALFVDGRYFQACAERYADSAVQVRRLETGAVFGFLEEASQPGFAIGYDPRNHSVSSLSELRANIMRSGLTLLPLDTNPIDAVWRDRQIPTRSKISPHPMGYAGEESASKRRRVAARFRECGAEALLVAEPAAVAWLLNIRARDIPRTPLPLSTAILHADATVDLFTNREAIHPSLTAFLGTEIRVMAEESVGSTVAALKGKRILIDPTRCSDAHHATLLNAGADVMEAEDPIALQRAIKNECEIGGAREAHRYDAVAMCRFLHWLSNTSSENITEISACLKLQDLRWESGALQDLSFDTIAGFGPNGAFIHHRVCRQSNRSLVPGSLFLIDSGGQYRSGTTDVTRTVAIGQPSADMKAHYTLVLQGHLALAQARFPAGTSGQQLDILARRPLWDVGLDYDHGTGHGVGSFLGVHEGPQQIAKRVGGQPLLKGMILSNEPGYYRPGAYGIRIENLQVVTAASAIDGGEIEMHAFEPLTMVPYARDLIVTSSLSVRERMWIDEYHRRVQDEIGPLVSGDDRQWLDDATAPL